MGGAEIPIALMLSAAATSASVVQGEKARKEQRRSTDKQLEEQRRRDTQARQEAERAPIREQEGSPTGQRQRRLRSLRSGIAQTIRTSSRGLLAPARLSSPALAAGAKQRLGQ